MIETSGAVPIVEPTRAVSLLVATPLVWALGCAMLPRRSASIASGLAALEVLLAVVTGTQVASALGRGHAGKIEHVASVARLGSLDLRIDLVADARAALVVLVAAVVGLALVRSEAAAARQEPGDPERARRLGWTGALLAGVALVSLGDGFAPLVAGAQLATLATFGLASARDGRHTRALLVATAGDGALVLAACLVFWGLGGTFGPAGWVSDAGARAALVATSEDAPPKKSTLVVTSYGGAKVTSDRDLPLPGEPLVPPFVAEVDPGVVSFRVALGPSSTDVLATNVTLAPRRSYVVVPLGSTASLREIAERARLAAPEASPEVLVGRSALGLPLRALVAVLVATALLARLVLVASARHALPALAVAGLVTADVAVRFVAVLGPGGAPVVGALGALGALAFAAHAAHAARPSPRARAEQGAIVATVASLAMTAAGALEPGAALTVALAGALALAAVAGDDPLHARWPSVASAVAVGLLPCAGVSAGLVPGLAGVLGDVASGRLTGVAGGLVLGATLLAIALLASAARWSVDGPGPREEAPSARGAEAAPAPRLAPRTTAVVALAAVAVGPVLGVGTHMFATAAPSLADRAIASSAFWPVARPLATGPHVALSVLVVVLVTGAAAAGWILAGKVVASPALEATRTHVFGGANRALEALEASGRLLVRGVVVVEREVLEDAGASLVDGATRFAARLARAEAAGSAFDRAAAASLARVGLDDPRVLARVRDVVLALGVAIPVLLVLSSWFLG